MNYRHVYMCIIAHAKKETELGLRPKNQRNKKNFPNQYFEFHHILPRSLFPNWKNRPTNKVTLTAREHFFCHQLLTHIYDCGEMYVAIYLMSHTRNNVLSSKEYEKVRLQCSKYLSKNSKGEKNGMYGKRIKDHPEWKRPDRSGSKNPNYGNHKLAGKNNPMYGKNIKDYMTPEAYEKWLKSRSTSRIGISCKKVICIEDNKLMNSYAEVRSIYGVPPSTLSRIIKTGQDCSACPGKHFKHAC